MQLSVQINTMRSKLIFYFWIFLITVGVGTVGMEEPSVTLHTDGQEYNQILWKFGPQNWFIARCNIRDTPLCEITMKTDEQINTFRGRLKMDDHGSLTIMNISDEQAGLYTLQIIKSNKKDEKKFNVSISSHKTVNDSKCSECVRQCSVMNVTRVTLSWNISSTGPFLEVKYQDTNGNSCEVNSSVSNQTKQDCQCMSPRSDSESGLDPWLIGVLVLVLLVGVAVVAAAAVMFYKNFCKKRKAERNEAEAGTMHEMEPLKPLKECAHRYEKENGKVSSIKSHPDERRSSRINGEL